MPGDEGGPVARVDEGDADLAVELPELVRIMCGILDIPVYANAVESLHVLFTLYSDFKANVHFQQQLAEETDQLDVEAAAPGAATNQLVL